MVVVVVMVVVVSIEGALATAAIVNVVIVTVVVLVMLVVVVLVMFVFVALIVVVTGALVTLLQERFVTYFGVTHCVMTKPASSSATLHSSREGTRCSIALTAFGASTEYLLRK